MKKIHRTKVSDKNKDLNLVLQSLDKILEKRSGGSINFKGIHYQVIYSCYLILKNLQNKYVESYVTLEGIEDVDLNSSFRINDSEYIQVKSSINKMDAGAFWNLGVLQNFLEVYKEAPSSKFRLVYDMKIAEGNLSLLINKSPIPEYWLDKLNTINSEINSQDFFDKISYEFKPLTVLYTEALIELIKNWNVNKGTERQFFIALFYNVIIWSKNRERISSSDINSLFQDIRDSYSKAVANNAFKNNWIIRASFDVKNPLSEEYYDGKAARPSHIKQGLPARRKIWEKEIEQSIENSDVTLIKSSSGQGKSTLAWQVSYNLLEKYSVYEIQSCQDFESANSIAEFLESRIHIGETPLIVIDGLSSLVAAWSHLVEMTSELSIKYLITTREEDWYRFGADISRINIKAIEISLSIQEAKDIYQQFKVKQKLHKDISTWQPIWEQVRKLGLLIEYTFLLTKGQMIKERLISQLKSLSTSNSSKAKIEILRLVSLADCLNLKLNTTNLITYIEKEIGFDADRGEILNELEKEYFLNFEGQYISGLHPVRSTHIKDLLHINLPVDQSLINLYMILDDNYRNEFFVNAPLLLTDNSKSLFYRNLADKIYSKSFREIVNALDGILHCEPLRYWKENKRIFDEAYKTGGLEIFAMATVPFSSITVLDELVDIGGDKIESFKRLSDLSKELPLYTLGNSDVKMFADFLTLALKKKSSHIESYEGLESLIKWFKKLEVKFSPSLNLSRNFTIDDLLKMEIVEAKELMLYYQISEPVAFQEFIIDNKKAIISYLKVNTDSVTIVEGENNIVVNYILLDKDVSNANELSVSRIQMVNSFLPFYEKYCTEAIMLPIPTEEVMSISKQASIKNLTPKALFDIFDANINKIWFSNIKKNYQENSAYHWQKSFIDRREIIIEWCKSVVRFIEALLENNKKKREACAKSLISYRVKLGDSLFPRRAYPKYENKHSREENFEKEDKIIDSWLTSLNNFNSQILGIFSPKEDQDTNLAMMQLKTVVINLPEMQAAFRDVERRTISYFDTNFICEEELKWFHRLHISVLYYLSQVPLENKIPVTVARKSIEAWWSIAKDEKINRLSAILRDAERKSEYIFHIPTIILEKEVLTYTMLGVENLDITNIDEIMNISSLLSELAHFPSDFFYLLIVKDDLILGGVRLNKNYFIVVNELLNGNEGVDIEGLTPLPVVVDEEILALFPKLRKVENSQKEEIIREQGDILISLWQLSEFRIRLDINSEIERNWLTKMEGKFGKEITSKINALNKFSLDEFVEFVEKGLNRGQIYSQDEIVNQLYKLPSQKLVD